MLLAVQIYSRIRSSRVDPCLILRQFLMTASEGSGEGHAGQLALVSQRP